MVRKIFQLSLATRGFSITEVVVSAAIFSIVVTSLVSFFVFFQKSSLSLANYNRAVLIAEEGLEAAKSIKDADFASLSDGTYGLTTSSNIWSLSANSDVTDIYNRQIDISTIDSDTKQVVSKVSWNDRLGGEKQVSLSMYLSNWAKEVVTNGSWSTPTTTYILDLNSSQDAWKVTLQNNYAYIIRQGSSPDFYIFDLSDMTNPTELGTLNLSGNLQDITVFGNYAYITSDSNSSEFIVLDISNPSSPIEIASTNLGGNDDPHGLFYDSNYVFLTRNPKNGDPWFSIINVSNANSPSLQGSITGNSMPVAYDVIVSGDYAYLATADLSNEIYIINILNKSTPSVLTKYDLPGNSTANTLMQYGSNIFVGRDNGEIDILDISNPTVPSLVSSYNDFGSSINDLVIAGPNNEFIFAASSASNNEFQVVNITDLSNPVLESSLDFADILYGIAYYEVDGSIIAVGAANNEEVVFLSPG